MIAFHGFALDLHSHPKKIMILQLDSFQGRIQDLIGGAQIVTGLKLPFWGLSFVEFWCWGLIFGGQGGGGPGPQGPPLDPPLSFKIRLRSRIGKIITVQECLFIHPRAYNFKPFDTIHVCPTWCTP